MLHGISGKPGGGKSYEAVVSHIIPVVTKDKRLVVTNLPLDIDQFCAVYGEYCRELIIVVDGGFHDYGGLRPFSEASHYLRHSAWSNEKGQKAYFFIDECHLAMGQQGTQKELVEFFSMHRHYGFDIMLITQNFRKVNRDIKDMIVNHYRAIKKSMMGQDDRYILKVHDGANNTNSSVVATHERIYEKKYFSFYQSHTKSNSAVDEATSNDIEKWYKHWSIKASIVFFAFGAFIISTKFTGNDKKPKKQTKKTVIEKTVNQKDSNALPVDNDNQLLIPNSEIKPKKQTYQKQKSLQQLQHEEMIAKSSTYHPFYKMTLSVSGSADYTDNGNKVNVTYFSAAQNGQHVFTLKSSDLLKAGYQLQILGDCAVAITYYEYSEYLTCNTPSQHVTLGDEQQLAAN